MGNFLLLWYLKGLIYNSVAELRKTYFMDNLSHFHSLEELIRALDRERKLLHALFQDRKKLSFRYDFARDLASKKDESIEFLRRYGVIRENTVLWSLRIFI